MFGMEGDCGLWTIVEGGGWRVEDDD